MSSKQPVPCTQGKSRKLLIGMFKAKAWEDRGDCQQVLAILREYPELAKKKYWTRKQGKLSALLCLLIAYQSSSSSADILDEVYNMHPKKIPQSPQMLCHICRGLESPDKLTSEKVFTFVRFILGKVTTLRCGDVPFDVLLSRQCSQPALITTQAGLDTLKLIVELCPDVLGRMDICSSTPTLLGAVLENICDDDVAAFLAQKYIDGEQIERVSIDLGSSLFCTECCTSVLKIMAHSKSLRVFGEGDIDSYPPPKLVKHFVKYLSKSESIASLDWRLPESWSQTLNSLLKANTSLRHLEIRRSSDGKNMGGALPWLSAVTESKTITSLTLGCGSFGRKMRLLRLPFEYHRSLQELTIDCEISHDLLCDILARLAMHAKVTLRRKELANEDLLIFVLKHTHVEYLQAQFSFSDLNSKRVCEALAANKIMRTLIAAHCWSNPAFPALMKVLMESNCTLVAIRDNWGGSLLGTAARDIECMLELNRKNRDLLHDPEAATISHFVNLLVHANHCCVIWSCSCNPQYALLRSRPGLWSRI